MYTNSQLAIQVLRSPNHSGKRNNPISIITPHCFVGQVDLKRGLETFQPAEKKASCNYVIDKDGKIGLCVDEANRSWCSSSAYNDNRSVTIEVASEPTSPYKINSKAYKALIELMADICRRNGKTHITWIPDKSKTMSMDPPETEMLISVHRWFANKSCPGDYIYNRLDEIAEEVNKILQPKNLYRVQVGAFKSYVNAKQLQSKLTDLGYKTILKEDDYYRVQVGAFGNKDNAKKLQSELKSKGYNSIIKEG